MTRSYFFRLVRVMRSRAGSGRRSSSSRVQRSQGGGGGGGVGSRGLGGSRVPVTGTTGCAIAATVGVVALGASRVRVLVLASRASHHVMEARGVCVDVADQSGHDSIVCEGNGSLIGDGRRRSRT